MTSLESKFARLATDNAPGQETRRPADGIETLLLGAPLKGRHVDFSHGDVDAFPPIPGSLDAFLEGVDLGGRQAYTEYRGSEKARENVAAKLTKYTGMAVSGPSELIITPGTQGALFLAIGSTVSAGCKVAVVQPDYFANRKLVEFFDGIVVPVELNYLDATDRAGLDLDQLENAFRSGARVLIFSNPNNPVGVVYSRNELQSIAELAGRYGAFVIVDQLYCRQIYDGKGYQHFCDTGFPLNDHVTVMGPSKTESLSGYRLGVAFGGRAVIERMEKLQAIVSLRAGGYNQSVLQVWFDEPHGWMLDRIARHQAIRDGIIAVLHDVQGLSVRTTEAGSYLFPQLPRLTLPMGDFVKVLRHQAAVTVTPGAEFGPDSIDSFRINFSQDHETAVQAMRRVAEMIDRYRTRD